MWQPSSENGRCAIGRVRRLLVAGLAAWGCLSLSDRAQSQLDPSGDWKTWHTEHFRVHAKAHLAHHARLVANEAERAHLLLSTELKPPRGPIDVVLSDDADFSNGYTTFFPTNRIVLYLTPPSTAISSGNYDGWLRMLVTHELTHSFHLDRADGIWRLLQMPFGRAPGLFPNAYQPAWVVEGIATYYESRFTIAGRIRGSYHDQLLSAASNGGAWPAPGDATRVNSVWPAGTTPYAWGGRFFESQSLEFGDSSIASFVDRTSRQLIVFNVNSPLKGAGTRGVDEIWNGLRDSAAVGGEVGELIDRGLRREPRLRLSSDGSLLAYRRIDGRNPERIVVRETVGANVRASRRVNSINELTWLDGDLFLTQLEFGSPVHIRSDLYRWDLSDGIERLTWGARIAEVFSYPGALLGATRLGSGTRQVYAVGDSGSMARHDRLPVPPADDWGRIAVSPDGERVAGARHADGRWDIALWPIDHPGEFRLVSDDPALDQDPVWSSEGKLLLFASERTGLPQIHAYDPVSRTSQRITNAPTGAREPALAPDGTLYYSTILGDGYAIAVEREWRREPILAASDAGERYLAAPDVPARETGFSPWAALRPRYWIPVGHDESAAGMFFGGLTSAHDPIGRTSYVLAAAVAPATGRWETVATLEHKRWRSWSADLAAAQTWEYAGLGLTESGGTGPVSVRERSAEAGVRYAWRRWRTSFGLRVGGFVDREDLVNDGSEPLGWVPDSATFGGALLSLGLTHSERAPLSISPENGLSVSGLYARRWEFGGVGWSNEARLGLSGYLALPLPGFAHWVLAARVSGGFSGGPDARTFSIGGESGEAVSLVPGTTLGSGRRRFPLRGYGRGGRFTRATAGILELRIPMLLAGKGMGRLPLLLDRVSANLFFEVGGGWNRGQEPNPTALSDVGTEITLDVGVGSSFLLRVRLGWALALREGLGSERGDSRVYLAFGPSF